MTSSYVLESIDSPDFTNPFNYAVPTLEQRQNLQIGDLVKLNFQTDDRGERMWVEVVEKVDGGYIGRLDNNPTQTDIQVNHRVRFEPQHIQQMWTADPAALH